MSVGASELKCEVCRKPAIGVASSALGAISHAYCSECAVLGREVWSTLVGGLYGCGPDNIGDWVRPIIEVTCAFYGKTENDLWADVERLDREYDEYMRKEYEWHCLGEYLGGLILAVECDELNMYPRQQDFYEQI